MIVRLGAFHIEISFLDCTGHPMAGFDLRKVLGLIYASNDILTGKVIPRTVRAHVIVDTALNAILYSEALDVPVPHLRDADTENEERGIVLHVRV